MFEAFEVLLERGREPLSTQGAMSGLYAPSQDLKDSNSIFFSSSLLQVTTGWETLTQTPVTVRSPLAPASSVTPLSTWPMTRGDCGTLEESGIHTSGDRG